MAYLANSQCRSLDVTDSFNLAGTDIVAALNALQSSDLATAAVFSTKQDVLANFANVASVNQNLSTSSDVRFNLVNIGANARLEAVDGQNGLMVSGGVQNNNRYLVLRPNTPVSGGTLIQYTTGNFYITKNGGGQSMYIDNNTGDVTIDGNVTSTKNIQGVTPAEFAQLANINSAAITNTQWTYLANLNQNVSQTSSVTFQNILLGETTPNPASGVRRDYVDGLVATAGAGLGKIGNVFSVNSAQTLSSLTLSGPALFSSGLAAPTFTTRSAGTKAVIFPNMSASTTDFAIGTETDNLWFSTGSASTGFKWYGGTTQIAALDGGGNFSINGLVVCNRISVANTTPTNSSHLTSKSYVDGLGYLITGAGLTKSASTISVNAVQTQITDVGTLTSLTVSGDVAINGTTDSATNGTGSVILAGGLYSAKKIRALGTITAMGGLVSASGVTVTSGGLSITGVSSFVNSLSCYALTAICKLKGR